MSAEPSATLPATAPRRTTCPAACPSRVVLDHVADKWSVLILVTLRDGPLRFNELRRRVEGITQKALAQVLRRLERNGIVARAVLGRSPVAVAYSVTPLGETLWGPICALHAWAVEHMPEVERARARYDTAQRT